MANDHPNSGAKRTGQPAARPPVQPDHQHRPEESGPADGQTRVEQNGQTAPRLPHERDQSADSQTPPDGEPTEVGRQAHEDVNRGLVDTDRGPELERLNKQLGR